MDGFFGVDSLCYNLTEASHQVSPQLLKLMVRQPERYWLVQVQGMAEKKRSTGWMR